MMSQRPKILIIDDTPVNLQTLGRALAADYDLHIANAGSTGLKLAGEIHPDIVLLDIMMPEMDGFAFLDALRAEGPDFAAIPVVVLTAKDLTAEERGLLSGRVQETLRKGAGQRENLLETIRRNLNPL